MIIVLKLGETGTGGRVMLGLGCLGTPVKLELVGVTIYGVGHLICIIYTLLFNKDMFQLNVRYQSCIHVQSR